MVVGTLTCFVVIHSVYDLKSAQINVKHRLIRELTLYGFEFDHNAVEPIKNICCANGEGTVD